MVPIAVPSVTLQGRAIIKNSEPAVHAVMESLGAKGNPAAIEGRIADIRDWSRIDKLFSDFKPDLVFHAAALKHVPVLERDWDEGVKTNVFGSVNVAEAAVRAGARGMVMISTDKAIEPVSVLGATKRFAEMYCQALDAEFARRSGTASVEPMRLIAVRFGNVLASNGSVIPKFKAQIEAGGPLTVTHPDMVRYFMTIREACDLVLTAASHAHGPDSSDVSVYVLNMGRPIKIVDPAERLIRLSGLEPGRDVTIQFTGIRPRERLNEVLFSHEEPSVEIGIPGVVAARPVFVPIEDMRARLAALDHALRMGDRDAVFQSAPRHGSGFQDRGGIASLIGIEPSATAPIAARRRMGVRGTRPQSRQAIAHGSKMPAQQVAGPRSVRRQSSFRPRRRFSKVADGDTGLPPAGAIHRQKGAACRDFKLSVP
ncbi:MAG: polysaccharide biosynthesis protein [Rhodoplanes sp.]|nr:polysaccharide biosynthesis protein [Rhodoplanes sp.]